MKKNRRDKNKMTDRRLFNPKCLAIAGGGVAFWYLGPTRDSPNHLLWAAVLASAIYVGISWYDVLYDCQDKNAAGSILGGYLARFKPAINPDTGRYEGKK